MHLPLHSIFSVLVQKLGNYGEGIARFEGYTLFIEGALPGETVECQLIEKKKSYGRAKLIKVVTPSQNRVKPPCALFGKCGGCQIMNLDYTQQLAFKREKVSDALERIGKLKGIEVLPCIASPLPLHYRNKIQLPVRKDKDGLKIGLYMSGSHDILDVKNCEIHCKLGEKVYNQVREILKMSFDEMGDIKHLLIKTAVHSQEVLVILVTPDVPTKALKEVAEKILIACPEVRGVVHNYQPEKTNVILGKQYESLAGQMTIEESLLGLKFKISPASFFQVNTGQAEALYHKVVELADLKGDESVLDAYCGVGTLSLILAPYAKKVIGIEYVKEAIEDAKGNAKLNAIDNVEFIAATVEEKIAGLKDIDVVVLNPPRQGCEQEVIKSLGVLLPKRIVYVSCDPATLARDLALLNEFEYRVEIVQPFDMFPQTSHVETVVKLTKL